MLDCLPAYTLCVPAALAPVTRFAGHLVPPPPGFKEARTRVGFAIEQVTADAPLPPPFDKSRLANVVNRLGWNSTYLIDDHTGRCDYINVYLTPATRDLEPQSVQHYIIRFSDITKRPYVLHHLSLEVGGSLVPLADLAIDLSEH